MADTPLEESNLANIGSVEDHAAREAAARCEVNWQGAGAEPGIQIWRVENRRDEADNPIFGIAPWPAARYGEFYNGDSYIVLQITKQADGNALQWDIYFWIGSQSSQDEYGVVAYKANELDDLLGDAPVQHREVEGRESPDFLALFGRNGVPALRILSGGIESGFRQVTADDETVKVPKRLYQIRRTGKVTRAWQIPMKTASMNQGDAFLLDAGNVIYTWFGPEGTSPFEKERCAEMAHNLAETRHGHCTVQTDVGDDGEFWNLIEGSKDDIPPAYVKLDELQELDRSQHKTKLYVLSDQGGAISISEVEPTKANLVSGDVCLIDAGHTAYIWVGKGSTKREQEQSMIVVDKYLQISHRSNTTSVTRVLEGQEARTHGFNEVLK